MQEREMPSKKPANKARKPAAAPRAGARKSATHKADARKAAPAARRPGAARPPARRAAAARTTAPAVRPEAAKAPMASSRGSVLTSASVVRPGVRPGERDEVEAVEPSSLLAGPRNVKPYVAKRGEQYMGKAQLRHFQEILLNWKHDLMMEVDRTVTHMKDEAANFPDPNDRATQEEEFSLELRTRDRERKLIRKIDEALKRAEDGTYGYCLETGEEIGVKRLEARPVATLSLEAQERRERRERQYGDRDDRYR
jgi:DnaK suppressor protein